MRVPPIARDREFHLAWLGHAGDFGLGATYEDFLSADVGQGRAFTQRLAKMI